MGNGYNSPESKSPLGRLSKERTRMTKDLTTGSLLIEIGGHGNNLNEALYAA